MIEIQKAIIEFLQQSPGNVVHGGFLLDRYDPDDILDAVFILKDRGLVSGTFPPNPNRRQGSDFGSLRLNSQTY
jgi:hypothetical protein